MQLLWLRTASSGTSLRGAPFDVIEVFDIVSGEWSTSRATVPLPRRHGAKAVAVYGKIWLIGGRDSDFIDTIDVFDPTTLTWSPGPHLPNGGIVWAGTIGI